MTAEQLALLGRVRGAGHRLLTVVNDVLDIAKAEAGHIEVQHDPVVLSPIVDEAVAMTAPQASAKHTAITVQDGDESLVCVGDSDRIEQILMNLSSNISGTPGEGACFTLTLPDDRK